MVISNMCQQPTLIGAPIPSVSIQLWILQFHSRAGVAGQMSCRLSSSSTCPKPITKLETWLALAAIVCLLVGTRNEISDNTIWAHMLCGFRMDYLLHSLPLCFLCTLMGLLCSVWASTKGGVISSKSWRDVGNSFCCCGVYSVAC